MKSYSEAKIQAFITQVENGNLKSNRAKVYNHILNHPGSSLADLAIHLHLSYHSLSGRLSELMDAGLIYINGQTSSSLSKHYVSEKEDRNRLIAQRKAIKYNQWLRESDNYTDILPSELAMALEVAKAGV